MTRRIAAAVVALGIHLAGPAVPATAAPDATAEQVVLANGHVDLGPRIVDGKWTIQLRDDTGTSTGDPVTWRSLDDVVLQASSKSRVTVPADPAYAFLGRPGSKVFVLPQVQQQGILWPGWNTQAPDVASRIDREVTWTLNAISGPGTFSLFLNGDFGKPKPIFDNTRPFPQQTGIDTDTHVHGNWAFGAEGTYLLDITMSARLTDGSSVSDRRTLRLYAGDTNPRAAFGPGPATAVPATAPPTAAAASEGTDVSRLWIAGAAVLGLLVITVAVLARRRTKGTAR